MNFRTRFATLAVLLVAFAARLNTLGDPAFWYDEGLVGWTARRDFLATARWTAADVHPPLYFWVVTVWRLFVGESEFALRLVSVFVGLLAVVAVYKIGERLQGPTLGCLAALFIGVARFHIWWSQELRMYILGSMFMLFSIWLTLRIMHPKEKPVFSEKTGFWDWIAYILVSVAGLYSIYLVAFALAFESLYVGSVLLLRNFHHKDTRAQSTHNNLGVLRVFVPLWLTLKDRMLWQWVGAQTVVALLFIPWFLYFLTQFRTWSDSTLFDFKLFVQFYATMLAVGVPSNIDQWLPAVIAIWAALLIGALIGLYGRLKSLQPITKSAFADSNPTRAGGFGHALPRIDSHGHDGASRRGGWLIVLLLALPPLSVYLGTTPRSFFYTPRVEARYLFPFIWSFYIVLAWCVWRIAKAQRVIGVLAALVVIELSGASDAQYYASRVPTDVYQSLTATLRAHRQPNDGVLLHDDRTWPIFEFYYASGERDWKGVPNGSRIRVKDTNFILAEYWEQHDAVWMIWNEDALRIDENHALEQWLTERAVFTRAETFGNKRLIFYARTNERVRTADALVASAKPTYATHRQIANGVWLMGYDQAISRYRVGDDMLLALYWHSERPFEVTASLQDEYRVEHARQIISIANGDSRTLIHFPVSTNLPHEYYNILVSAAQGITYVARVEIDQSSVPASLDVNIQTPREVKFQNGIRLLGYDANVTTLRAGDYLPLTLYWQTDQPITQRYKVFAHVLGAQYNPKSKNFLWGQQDQEPLNGALPTTAWGVNRVIADPYLVPIARDAPSGHYVIEIGFYHSTTGERLMTVDGADHVNLFEVEVQ